jgi:hypothetical protein
MPKSELFNFMQQMKDELAAEYERIRIRATDDPGTAGDEGEENWAALFRSWLPANYHVVTKGRIINAEGKTGPQVDVLGSRPRTWCTSCESWFGWTLAQLTTADNRAV